MNVEEAIKILEQHCDQSNTASEIWGHEMDALSVLRSRIEALEKADRDLRLAFAKHNQEVCQELGKALKFPWFKDDQKNFPGATEEHGVIIGDDVPETMAVYAARRIEALEKAQADACEKASEILADALSGQNERYIFRPAHNRPGFVTRWARVELDLHRAIKGEEIEGKKTSQPT
jgi:hypothetical protein